MRGHRETIGERLRRDCEALMVLPPAPFDACDRQGTRVSSLSLVRYRTNDYSVPVAYGHIPRDLFADILRRIDRLRTTPLPT